MSEFSQLGNRYDIGQVIGRGGMAEVYEGTDRRLNRRVAIKVLRPDLARDPMFQERFRREAQSAAGLNHPNIVAIYDTGEDVLTDGVSQVTIPYIVMEYVDGTTLRQMLQRGPRILPERSLEICAGILAALDYAHRHGIVHRDIKPANVMINTHGDAKVMDFGIARALSDGATSVTTTSAVMGTAQYLSPEQARGELVDARSDIYSTGCLLYELLTGVTPFTGESPVSIAYQHVNEPPKPPSQLDPAVSATLDGIVLHALAKQPDNRYHTAAEMRADVERAMAGMPTLVTMTGATTVLPTYEEAPTDDETLVPMHDEEAPKKNTLKWLAAGVAAMAAAGLLFFAGSTLFGSSMTKVTVPNLSTKTVAEATTALENMQLVLGVQTPMNDDNAPKGTVISQNPAAGELLEQGQKVDVTVSNGKEQVAVPDLVNMVSEDAAKTALEDIKLSLGKVTTKDSLQPAGTVISQSPKAGDSVTAQTPIDIVVSTGKVTVPSLQDLDATAAQALLEKKQLLLGATTKQDSSKPEGTIIGQSPQAGKSVVSGTRIDIVVSSGKVTVPDLINLATQNAARLALESAHLTLGAVTERDSGKSAGTVVGQSLAAGKSAVAGTAVDIVISSGKVIVPDLINLASQDAARVALESVNLTLGTVSSRASSQPAGTVLAQSLAAGKIVTSNTQISIVISNGTGSATEVAVPDVIGESRSQANTDLVNAGFRVQWIYAVDDSVPANTVLAQTPIGGNMAKPGTTITVEISKVTSSR